MPDQEPTNWFTAWLAAAAVAGGAIAKVAEKLINLASGRGDYFDKRYHNLIAKLEERGAKLEERESKLLVAMEGMEKNEQAIRDAMTTLEKSHEKCEVENANLRAEVESLKGRCLKLEQPNA